MGWVVNATSRPLYPAEKTRYQLHRWLDENQSRSRPVWKISPPPGFDPRTVQPVASHYTVYCILAHMYVCIYVCVYVCIYIPSTDVRMFVCI